MRTDEEKPTLSDLLEALKGLSPEILARPIVWWGDDRGGMVKEVVILDEDWVQDEEGLVSRSQMRTSIAENDSDLTEAEIDDELATFTTRAVAGQLILEVD